MTHEMRMLLWKDFRLNIYCFVAGVAFIAIPYLLLFFHDIQFTGMWMFSTCLSQLTLAILGGNIIASEREDRSATFLDYQGASRKMVVCSKLICCIVTLVVINATAFIMSIWVPSNGFYHEHHARPWQIMGAACVTGIYFLGCCWLISLFSQPMIAKIGGVLSPYVFFPCLAGIGYILGIRVSDDTGAIIVVVAMPVIGLSSLVAGTWYFLRSKDA
jgi:ABC-type transport system involved in multi-copper enzyme maturation permease subunit